ncbi:MAG TPA: PAS domain S-box protein [Solirubrobacterales bacterium]|nr:PAS domain S-box protein [Solirubrobacterales bacterium]
MDPSSSSDETRGTGRFEALLASVADPIYMVDSTGLIQFANPAAVSLLGFESEMDLLGRPSHQTIHHHRPDGSPFPEEECPLLEPLRNGGTVRVEEDWFVRADGSMVPVSYSSAAFRLESGWGAVVAFRDITERRELEASERRRAAEQARSAELDASRRRVIAATDEARRRIVRDLHDGAQQQLLNAAMLIREGMAELELRDGAEVPEAFGLAAERIRESMAELRELAAGVHPVVLQSRGLAAGLDSLASRCSVPVRLRVAERRFDPEVETAAYFLVAEALNNVEKHAGASLAEVEVELAGNGEELIVSVADDGSGEIAAAEGMGLPGMADRVDALGGRIEFRGEPGQGSRVTAAIPL